MMTDTCTCKDVAHEHHQGRPCDRPAVAPSAEIEEAGKPDEDVGAICLECYQLIAVAAHEADPTAVVDLTLAPSFPVCESPTLA